MRYDWREFQEFLSVNHRAPAQGALPAPGAPALFVSDGETVVTGYCPNENLEEWQGATASEVREHFRHREHLVVPREAMNAWMRQCWEHEGYYEQILGLRERVSTHAGGAAAGKEPRAVRRVAYPHFLLEALQGWWSKLIPVSYGILIRVEPPPASASASASLPARNPRRARDFYLVVRRGRFEEFGTPDYTGIGKDRAKSEAETVKYLSEKHGVPFQGAFLPERDFEEWSRINDPWKLVMLGIRAEKLRLVPFRWGVAALIAVRAYLGF